MVKKRKPKVFSLRVKPKNRNPLPMCEICLDRLQKKLMKRGFRAKILHEGRLLCTHHYKLETGMKTIVPPAMRIKRKAEDGIVVEGSPTISGGSLLKLLRALK